jgi:hypothetical protein
MTNVWVIGRNITIDGAGRICAAFEKNLASAFYKKNQNNYNKILFCAVDLKM